MISGPIGNAANQMLFRDKYPDPVPRYWSEFQSQWANSLLHGSRRLSVTAGLRHVDPRSLLWSITTIKLMDNYQWNASAKSSVESWSQNWSETYKKRVSELTRVTIDPSRLEDTEVSSLALLVICAEHWELLVDTSVTVGQPKLWLALFCIYRPSDVLEPLGHKMTCSREGWCGI